jgi:hypothetical protein
MTPSTAKRRKNQQRKNKRAAKASGASVMMRSDATGPSAIGGGGFHVLVFLVAFLIVCSRRPDAVLNAQFWAEDGAVWYHDAYQFGWHSLFMTAAGYTHIFTRFVSILALWFPFPRAPLVMNLCAIAVQILPVTVFLSSRFSEITLPVRGVAAFLYLAIPNSFEIDANITNVQWHLALLCCLVLLAQPGESWGWRAFDGLVVVFTSLSSPLGIPLVPVAAFLWWKRRQPWQAVTLGLLISSALIQVGTVVLHLQDRQMAHVNLSGQVTVIGGANGATWDRFVAILGRQVFLSSLLGVMTQPQLMQWESVHLIELIATVIGLMVLLYALRYGPTVLRLFILFAFVVFAMSLAHPLAGLPSAPQWDSLCFPGDGNRYYFLPMLAFLASLSWMASRSASPRLIRYFAVALLLLLPIGIYQDWRYPPYGDYQFQEYAEQFERAPAGTKMTIPINPDWSMELTKR